jgi:enoyl-CoA hydratase/carnithine racemase
MGLITGAGGTVSITKRVGIRRAARMALLVTQSMSRTALAWGLIDEIG